jgi:hypothetical protein
MRKIILIILIFSLVFTNIGFAQEDNDGETDDSKSETKEEKKSHIILDEEEIKGEVEAPNTFFIQQKATPDFKEVEPDSELLNGALLPEDEIPQENKHSLSVSKSILWTSTATGITTGLGSLYMYNHDEEQTAKNLAVVSGISLSISLLTYLISR